MENKFWLAAVLTFLALAQPAAAAPSAPPLLQSFWESFKSAVVQKNMEGAAQLTQFPVSMPYGLKSVKTEAEFKKRYGEIFNGEADAVKCFAKAKLEKWDSKNYFIACGFKEDPTGGAGEPILYRFQQTKTGWKFVGLDNINE